MTTTEKAIRFALWAIGRERITRREICEVFGVSLCTSIRWRNAFVNARGPKCQNA